MNSDARLTKQLIQPKSIQHQDYEIIILQNESHPTTKLTPHDKLNLNPKAENTTITNVAINFFYE